MPLASSKSASRREVDNRDDPAPEAPDYAPRRAAIASMVKQAPALIRAGYFADAARMRTAVDLGEVPA